MAAEKSLYGSSESLILSEEIRLLRVALQLLMKASDILLHLPRFADLHLTIIRKVKIKLVY